MIQNYFRLTRDEDQGSVSRSSLLKQVKKDDGTKSCSLRVMSLSSTLTVHLNTVVGTLYYSKSHHFDLF